MAAKAALRPLVFPTGPLPWLKPAVFTGGLVPLCALLVRAYRGTLGANPIAEALNQLGLLALVFVLGSLACTPLKTLTVWTWPIRLRRMLGLYGFFYASVHFFTYVALDQGFAVTTIVADILKRPFIWLGFLAFVLLVPLAVTSTPKMVKRLGFARWKQLHRLAYVAAVFGALHFLLRVKKDLTEPLLYAVILGLLFAVRVGAWLNERKAPAKPSRAAGAG